MLKLKRYAKPYLALLLIGVLLLFGQAMTELELPNIMSSIVNDGIQKGGITHSAPEAISAEGYAMMTSLMNETDKAAVEQAYAQAGEEDLAALREEIDPLARQIIAKVTA